MNFADFVAILNILANCVEIAGFLFGLPMLLVGAVPACSGLRGYSKKLLVSAPVMIFTGVTMPQIINGSILKASTNPHATFLYGLIAFISLAIFFSMMAWCVYVFFLPTIIGRRENKANQKGILICNLLSVMPICWAATFIWACLAKRLNAPLTQA